MKIEDYRKADCSLFRVPPVNFSQIESDLERTIVQAWRAGYDPNSALSSVSNDKTLIKKIADQISQSLNFQRRVGLDEVKEEALQKVNELNDQYKDRVNSVEEILAPEEEARKARLQEQQNSYREKSTVYNASSASLQDMKYRIRDQLAELGGEEGIDAILEIEQEVLVQEDGAKTAVTSDTSQYKPRDVNKPHVESTIERAARESVFKKHRDNNQKKREDPLANNETTYLDPSLKEDISEINRPENDRGFWRTVWRVLNYKIW